MMARAVVLAAGESRRMGAPKMLLPWGGTTVLGAVVEALLGASVERIAVVLGHRAGEIRQAVPDDPKVTVCVNERYPEGMLTSIQAGVRALGGGTGPVLVCLGDQPLITPEVVSRVLATHAGGLTVPTYDGRRGHPVAVDASLTDELLALPPEVGLRGLFLAHPDRVSTVAVPSSGVLVDLDTPADYDAYRPDRVGR